MPIVSTGVSFAEKAETVVAIDLADRFRDVGARLAAEQGGPKPRFSRADGMVLPFRDASFDLVISHAVIEHVKNPGAYLREARRVLRPGGRLFLETAPYLSPTGVHLPRLRFPIPPYLILGRRLAFRLSWWLARHAPGTFRASIGESSFLAQAKRGETKTDDLCYLVTLRNLREHIAAAGFTLVREDLEISKLARRTLPGWLVEQIPRIPIGRDVPVHKAHEPVPDTRANPVDVPAHDPHSFRLRVVGDRRHWSPAPSSPVECGDSLPEHGRRRAFPRLPLIDDGLPRCAHQCGQLPLAQSARATKRANLRVVVAWNAGPSQWRTTVHRLHRSTIVRPPKLRGSGGSCAGPKPAKGGPGVIGHRQPAVPRRRPQRLDVHPDEQREHG